jgi:hypothetical protein
VTITQTTLTALVLAPVALLVALFAAWKTTAEQRHAPALDKLGLWAMQATFFFALYAFSGGVVLALKAIWT